MNKDQYASKNIAVELPWPKVKWRLAFWLSFVPFISGAILLFYPELPQAQYLRMTRNRIGIISLIVPVLVPLLFWSIRVFAIAVRRIRYYGNLYTNSVQINSEYVIFKRNTFELFERLDEKQTFEITGANYQNNHFYIVLRRRIDVALEEGDVLTVIHKEDSKVMGMFSIIDIHDTSYNAVSIGGLDPVWKGFVREQIQDSFFPHMHAIYVPQGESE